MRALERLDAEVPVYYGEWGFKAECDGFAPLLRKLAQADPAARAVGDFATYQWRVPDAHAGVLLPGPDGGPGGGSKKRARFNLASRSGESSTWRPLQQGE